MSGPKFGTESRELIIVRGQWHEKSRPSISAVCDNDRAKLLYTQNLRFVCFENKIKKKTLNFTNVAFVSA